MDFGSRGQSLSWEKIEVKAGIHHLEIDILLLQKKEEPSY